MLATQSTAGAIPVRNEKGEVSMQKVKVQRYISGKRPEYALKDTSDESSNDEDYFENRKSIVINKVREIGGEEDEKRSAEESEEELDDPRLRRLRATKQDDIEDRLERHHDSSEYEEDESDEEDHEPRIKPQFVRRRDRTTIIEKENDLIKQKQMEQEAKKLAKERRRYTLKLVEDSIKKDMESQKAEKDPHINDVQTDDENDELEYESWKLRELKRIKRERDERDILDKEKNEIERLRNLTEEERRKELQMNPKLVTNKGVKGKYKFLQKYYHRGAFYLDKEETVFKQDFSAPTLEDHFDKTILPKVMQVKNFGRCGRTKYTHLVDQDTTKFDSPWVSETAGNIKFVQERAGGMKQVFDRPSYNKRKKE
ncbi:CLUMA_CG010341, isoform A [Clunio marinus]|uniref:CLUMA_CG010341, isoform A n=1 Tax=Clunio marinus TaxID=568069 RepID=A0A1J1I9M2_9DIPT|nr:CLUMA_CG010341, isoform A [Clunio marinus]